MEQHAIPQQISSYEFKLVGDMTLKQFLKAAVGIILAIIIKNTSLIALFKWPLMFAFAGLGLALAFLPFEDRPLDNWIISFLKSIYAPTIFVYNKKNNNNWLNLPPTSEDNTEAKPVVNKNIFVSVKKQTTEGTMTINQKGGYFAPSINVIEEKVATKKDEPEIEKEIVGTIDNKEVVPELREEVVGGVETQRQSVDLNLKKDKLEATGKAVFGTIPMPNRPDVANIVVGMATNWDGKIIDGVIIEIQDEHGIPTRVIKTNSLGQFKISTPLADGRYLIIAEKEGYHFDRVNVDLNGQIIDPIKIIAQN